MAKLKKQKTAIKKKVTSKFKTKSTPKKEIAIDEKKVKAVANRIIRYAKSNSQKNKTTNNFPLWYAGIANKPKIRKVGHKAKLGVKELPTFKAFDAETFANARAVEIYLCDNNAFQHCRLEGKPNKDDHVSPSRYTYTYFIPAKLRKK